MSSGDLEASGLGEGRSPQEKNAKLDSLAGVNIIAKHEEVSKKNVAETAVDHCHEALDYKPEAEEGSVINEETVTIDVEVLRLIKIKMLLMNVK